MRKKILIPVVAAMLLSAAFIGVLIYSAYSGKKDNDSDIKPDTNLNSLVSQNAESAFAFLTEEKNEMPDNMRGYIINPETDIDLSDTSENALKTAVESVFDKVDAILPNTVVISYSDGKDYKSGEFDYLKYLIDTAHGNDLTVVFSLANDEFKPEKIRTEKITALADEYSPDAVMLYTDNIGGNLSAKIAELKKALNDKNKSLGLSLPEKISDGAKSSIEKNEADFYFINVNSSTEAGGESIIKSWAECGLKSNSRLYAVLRNDLVMSGNGWNNSDEISRLIKILYNNGGFSGCVMSSREKLASDDNNTATNLYSYYEFFNDVEYTALTLSEFSLKDEKTVIFKGTSDSKYPIHTWCTADNAWKAVPSKGEKGEFTAEIPLSEGKNKIILKHKNAMYTYYIDRAVDVMKTCSATVDEEGKSVTLTVSAVKGAKVWASLANTVLTELAESAAPSGDGAAEKTENYVTYSAVYKLEKGLASLEGNQVSFAAEYNGLVDINMCSEQKKVSPYDDNGLGRSLMCEVTSERAEVTPASNNDDTSDPTYTPQLRGSYGYVDSFSVTDNHVNFITATGMKIHSGDARLIINGYTLPENNVTLESVTEDNSAVFTFSSTYPVFTRTVLSPQNYYKGFLERIYNVKEFTSEYLDIMFMDTSVCSVLSEFDFSGNSVISNIEWLTNKDDKIIVLRLYLKNKNLFSGYSLNTDENGRLVLKIKNKPSSLQGTVIMLDPGHGGYGSPGTYSVLSVYEKDVTLAIARKTAEMLKNLGADVILTREGDEAVFLNERTEMIRKVEPDIFASIHCDGSDSESQYGTHTFYYRNYSMPLASSIHKQLVGAYRSYYYTDPKSDAYNKLDLDYKFFPYNVTRVEECPSVLIECGYLTNKNDAVFLTDENGQKIIATAIAQGIVDYITSAE